MDVGYNLTAKHMNQIGVSRARLRYWERLGLLRPQRQPNSRQWRRYSDEDLQTGRRMLHLLNLGLTLDGSRRNLARLAEIEQANSTIVADSADDSLDMPKGLCAGLGAN